jgi:putative endonuclease
MWLYIMANRYRGTMYVGVTNSLSRRIWEHQQGFGSEFVRTHRLLRLVYAEHHDNALSAIAQEKRLKRWRREFKFRLIESANPEWLDRSGAIHLD